MTFIMLKNKMCFSRWIIFRLRTFYLREFKRYRISRTLKIRAEKAFRKRVRWYQNKGRNPYYRVFLGRIIRGASHDAYDPLNPRAFKTKRGHRIRQRVRKYLYNRLGLNYRMR